MTVEKWLEGVAMVMDDYEDDLATAIQIIRRQQEALKELDATGGHVKRGLDGDFKCILCEALADCDAIVEGK